jgi:two-component system NarL family sensor kinase
MPANRTDITQFIAWGTIMFSLLGIFIIVFLFYYRKRHMTFHRQEQEFQQTILRTQLEIQEQTMKNISQEIHDNVGQLLSLAKLNLATADTSSPEKKDEKIQNSKDLVSKAIRDLRNLSHSLNTDFISELGLSRAIESELTLIRKSGELGAQFSVDGNPFELEEDRELIIFRIVQESLNNIIKHAKAKEIKVQLIYDTDLLKLVISDNGTGFDVSPLNDASNTVFGLGIRNMNGRANLIGADFSITSTLGNGTTTTLTISKNNKKTNL